MALIHTKTSIGQDVVINTNTISHIVEVYGNSNRPLGKTWVYFVGGGTGHIELDGTPAEVTQRLFQETPAWRSPK